MNAVIKRVCGAAGLLALAAGCQQRMADQPGHRGYEESSFFPNGQGVRPLEPGVVYRGQKSPADPLVTGLSPEGRKARTGDAGGAAAFDPKSVVPPVGAPDDVKNYAAEFPFTLAAADLKRGQQRYNVFCALCHGAAGDGNGKIVERGFLRPPSYHVDPEGKKIDTAATGRVEEGKDPKLKQLQQGYSRGFGRYGKDVPLKDVPVGYIFQVITQGYGGMPDHASQIPPEDRWRIAAYVRALQLSQGADVSGLPADAKKRVEDGLSGKVSPIKKDDGHGH